VKSIPADGVYQSTSVDIVFPKGSNGEIACLFGQTTREVTAAILTACGPRLQIDLAMKGHQAEPAQSDTLFAMQVITPEQQTTAYGWLFRKWKWNSIIDGERWGTNLPPLYDSSWWKFVAAFMREKYGFGIRAIKGGGQKLVANDFWKTHHIDVVQVGLAHRTRTRQQGEQVDIMRNGRPYGILKPQVRKCFRCPTSRAETLCVRQRGKEWVCMTAESSTTGTGKCHRDFYTAIDTGYLDVEIPNDERPSGVMIEEIKEPASAASVEMCWAKVPDKHRRLLENLGFVGDMHEVTA
jgi:hypothetical protein